jgi:hypothetical protein
MPLVPPTVTPPLVADSLLDDDGLPAPEIIDRFESTTVDQLAEYLDDHGTDVGGAHAPVPEVVLEGAGKLLGFPHPVEGSGLQGIFPVFPVHVTS